MLGERLVKETKTKMRCKCLVNLSHIFKKGKFFFTVQQHVTVILTIGSENLKKKQVTCAGWVKKYKYLTNNVYNKNVRKSQLRS